MFSYVNTDNTFPNMPQLSKFLSLLHGNLRWNAPKVRPMVDQSANATGLCNHTKTSALHQSTASETGIQRERSSFAHKSRIVARRLSAPHRQSAKWTADASPQHGRSSGSSAGTHPVSQPKDTNAHQLWSGTGTSQVATLVLGQSTSLTAANPDICYPVKLTGVAPWTKTARCQQRCLLV